MRTVYSERTEKIDDSSLCTLAHYLMYHQELWTGQLVLQDEKEINDFITRKQLYSPDGVFDIGNIRPGLWGL